MTCAKQKSSQVLLAHGLCHGRRFNHVWAQDLVCALAPRCSGWASPRVAILCQRSLVLSGFPLELVERVYRVFLQARGGEVRAVMTDVLLRLTIWCQ